MNRNIRQNESRAPLPGEYRFGKLLNDERWFSCSFQEQHVLLTPQSDEANKRCFLNGTLTLDLEDGRRYELKNNGSSAIFRWSLLRRD